MEDSRHVDHTYLLIPRRTLIHIITSPQSALQEYTMIVQHMIHLQQVSMTTNSVGYIRVDSLNILCTYIQNQFHYLSEGNKYDRVIQGQLDALSVEVNSVLIDNADYSKMQQCLRASHISHMTCVCMLSVFP